MLLLSPFTSSLVSALKTFRFVSYTTVSLPTSSAPTKLLVFAQLEKLVKPSTTTTSLTEDALLSTLAVD
jgi:hypothetical protein